MVRFWLVFERSEDGRPREGTISRSLCLYYQYRSGEAHGWRQQGAQGGWHGCSGAFVAETTIWVPMCRFVYLFGRLRGFSMLASVAEWSISRSSLSIETAHTCESRNKWNAALGLQKRAEKWFFRVRLHLQHTLNRQKTSPVDLTTFSTLS